MASLFHLPVGLSEYTAVYDALTSCPDALAFRQQVDRFQKCINSGRHIYGRFLTECILHKLIDAVRSHVAFAIAPCESPLRELLLPDPQSLDEPPECLKCWGGNQAVVSTVVFSLRIHKIGAHSNRLCLVPGTSYVHDTHED